MYVLYIDVLFGINWSMDTLIFLCVSLVLNRRVKWSYIVWGSMIAALVYCMLWIMPVLWQMPQALYAILVPIPSILWIYRPKCYKEFFKIYIVSMTIAAVFGGIIFNLWYTFVSPSSSISSIHVMLLVGIGVVITLGFYSGFYYLRRQLIFPAFEYKVDITYGKKQVQVLSLLDTGNLLYTPQRHEPVLVVEFNAIQSILEKEQIEQYKAFMNASWMEIEKAVIEGDYKMEVMIPFNSVGCRSGVLWGIRVDQVKIQKGTKKILVAPCVIGIASEKLFTDGQFQALLHPEFILEEVTA